MRNLRLLHLREQTEAVGETMAAERGRFRRLAREDSAPRAVSAFNLFQTPPELAARLAALLGPCERILEPSAGLGRLYRAVREADHTGGVVMVEQSPECCRELYDITADDSAAWLFQGDFLARGQTSLGGLFDGVLMNPPFKMWRDIKHIEHARQFLAPGGKLVALCANGPRQRVKLMPEADYWEDLPAGSFKSEGTNVNAAICVFEN
jgi:hypothetical protein